MRLILGAALGACALSQLVSDVAYPEVVSQRLPWTGVWDSQSLPTGWQNLPCTDAFTSFVGTADGVTAALLVCSDGRIHNAINPARVYSPSVPVDGSFTFVGVSGTDATTAVAASDSGSLFTMACAGSSCALSRISSHAAGGISDIITFTTAVGRFVWLTGSNGTQALLLPAAGGAATTVYRDAASSYAALAYSAAKQEVALGNASKLLLLDASLASSAPNPSAVQFPLRRWLWVTNITSGAGGEIDDIITVLAYDDTLLPPPTASAFGSLSFGAEGFDGASTVPGPFDMFGFGGAAGAGSGYSGNGTLYIGNPTALNILYPDGTVARIDGMGGLPWGNITSIAVAQGPQEATPGADSRLIILGTTMGVAIYDPYGTPTVQNGPYGAWGQYPYAAAPPVVGGSAAANVPRTLHEASTGTGGLRRGGKKAQRRRSPHSAGAQESEATAASASPATLYYQPAWRYMFGPRWLPCTPSDTLSSVVRRRGVLAIPASAAAASGGVHLPVGRASELQLGAPSSTAGLIVTLTDAGAALLQTQMWHVADKATLMEALLPPHIVDGQINDCSYPSFGLAATCTWGPGANDGLWSSLVVASESFRYAVTGDSDARDRAWQVFGGMKLLNDVTGITGLIARAAVDPSFPPQPPRDDWHNSSSMPGYQWMGDASSDEVAGHAMAYPIMASLVAGGNATEWATITNVLRNLVSRINRLADMTCISVCD